MSRASAAHASSVVPGDHGSQASGLSGDGTERANSVPECAPRGRPAGCAADRDRWACKAQDWGSEQAKPGLVQTFSSSSSSSRASRASRGGGALMGHNGAAHSRALCCSGTDTPRRHSTGGGREAAARAAGDPSAAGGPAAGSSEAAPGTSVEAYPGVADAPCAKACSRGRRCPRTSSAPHSQRSSSAQMRGREVSLSSEGAGAGSEGGATTCAGLSSHSSSGRPGRAYGSTAASARSEAQTRRTRHAYGTACSRHGMRTARLAHSTSRHTLGTAQA